MKVDARGCGAGGRRDSGQTGSGQVREGGALVRRAVDAYFRSFGIPRRRMFAFAGSDRRSRSVFVVDEGDEDLWQSSHPLVLIDRRVTSTVGRGELRVYTHTHNIG